MEKNYIFTTATDELIPLAVMTFGDTYCAHKLNGILGQVNEVIKAITDTIPYSICRCRDKKVPVVSACGQYISSVLNMRKATFFELQNQSCSENTEKISLQIQDFIYNAIIEEAYTTTVLLCDPYERAKTIRTIFAQAMCCKLLEQDETLDMQTVHFITKYLTCAYRTAENTKDKLVNALGVYVQAIEIAEDVDGLDTYTLEKVHTMLGIDLVHYKSNANNFGTLS